MKRILIIDSNALVHRAFHALPPLKTKDGKIVNAVYGFLSILLRVIGETKPEYVVATFDLAGPTFRNLEYAQYKAKRVKAPQELYDQIPLIKKSLNLLDIPIYEKKGFEADDIIGTITEKVKKMSVGSVVVTGDMDTLQLVSEKVVVYALKSGIKKAVIFNEKNIKEKYGLKPSQLVDFRGLKGDPSDNIPGVSGVGEKTALKLIREFGSMDDLYKDSSLDRIDLKTKARLLEYKENAFLSRHLSEIKKDVPFDFKIKKWGKYNKEKFISFLKEMEFDSLVRRFSL